MGVVKMINKATADAPSLDSMESVPPTDSGSAHKRASHRKGIDQSFTFKNATSATAAVVLAKKRSFASQIHIKDPLAASIFQAFLRPSGSTGKKVGPHRVLNAPIQANAGGGGNSGRSGLLPLPHLDWLGPGDQTVGDAKEKSGNGDTKNGLDAKPGTAAIYEVLNPLLNHPLKDSPTSTSSTIQLSKARLTPSAKDHWMYPKAISIMSKDPEGSFRPSNANARRRLAILQFRACWEKFAPHLPPNFVATRLVETGEALLEIPGFYDVADMVCFSPCLERGDALYGSNHALFATSSRKDITSEDGGSNTSLGVDVRGFSESNPDNLQRPVSEDDVDTPAHHISLSLRMRCEYGKSLCKYLHLTSMASALKSPGVKASMLEFLDQLKAIREQCLLMTRGRARDRLVLRGISYLTAIIESLVNDGNGWKELLIYLTSITACIENTTTLFRPRNLPLLVDIYILTHRLQLKHTLGYIGDSFILQCARTIEKMYTAESDIAVRKEGAALDEKSFEAAFGRMNHLLFGCQLALLGMGKKLAIIPGLAI
ncbi:hypothetical protein HDU67_008653 [Dinochytrium kinnereticum]|nr:hypothetical protein HDU67_008653 [Dinochytrium kinnereticum]